MKHTVKFYTVKRSIIAMIVMLLFVLCAALGVQAKMSADTMLQKSFKDTYQYYGDINNDMEINLVDVILAQKSIAKIKNFKLNEKIASDVDGSGRTDMDDIVMIQKYIAQLRYKFPAGKLFHIIQKINKL